MLEFDLDPEEVRSLGVRAAELVAEHRAGLAAGPVFGKVGEGASAFDEPLPQTGQPAEEVLRAVRERILNHPFGNSHPRFFAFINATADPLGIVADYLAASMNSNCWGGDHAAIHVEKQVLKWLASILGLPDSSEGILTSGGSMANFTALATARRAVSPDVRETGFAGTEPLVVYVSEEVHNCVDKAVDLLGIGWKQLRKIPTDDGFRIRVDLLKQAIADDRRAGRKPAIVVGNAGTVNTGAIDPLDELAELCAREGLWFHADGAYGAMATISPRLRPLFRGLERADSVAADPHKWLYVPYEAGATLVREPGRMAEAFAAARALPGARPREPRARPGLVQRARARAVARLQGAQGVDGPQAARRPGLRGRGRPRRGDGARARLRGERATRTSSCWRRPCCRSSPSAIGRPTRRSTRPRSPASTAGS